MGIIAPAVVVFLGSGGFLGSGNHPAVVVFGSGGFAAVAVFVGSLFSPYSRSPLRLQ